MLMARLPPVDPHLENGSFHRSGHPPPGPIPNSFVGESAVKVEGYS